MPHTDSYGFGRREGAHLNAFCETCMQWAAHHDVALPELLGYMAMAEYVFHHSMIGPQLTMNPSPEFPPDAEED